MMELKFNINNGKIPEKLSWVVPKVVYSFTNDLKDNVSNGSVLTHESIKVDVDINVVNVIIW